jgi:hypothetical protein
MGLGRSLGYRAAPLSELNPMLNAETAVIVMLETAEGIEIANFSQSSKNQQRSVARDRAG